VLACSGLVERLTEEGAVSVRLFFSFFLSAFIYGVPDILFLLARSCRIVDSIICFDRIMKVLIIKFLIIYS
jgi:hypothetical protein